MVRSVLIIDDDADVCAALTRAMRAAGVDDVRVASGAQPGVAEFRRMPADLLITDMIMPAGGDGLDVIKAIRPEFPNAAIVAISGGGALGATNFKPEAVSTCAYLAAASAAGANAVIAKPFDTRELLEAIRRAAQYAQHAAPVPVKLSATQ